MGEGQGVGGWLGAGMHIFVAGDRRKGRMAVTQLHHRLLRSLKRAEVLACRKVSSFSSGCYLCVCFTGNGTFFTHIRQTEQMARNYAYFYSALKL